MNSTLQNSERRGESTCLNNFGEKGFKGEDENERKNFDIFIKTPEKNVLKKFQERDDDKNTNFHIHCLRA